VAEHEGLRIREVGTTNRSARDDYRSVISENTGCLLKVHPSNFKIAGFTSLQFRWPSWREWGRR